MKLLEPGIIGNVLIRNRAVMAPMAIHGFLEPDGSFSQRAIDYYAARAKGGTGLIITGATWVDVSVEGVLLPSVPRVDSSSQLSRLRELSDTVHSYGAKLCIQLALGVGRVGPTNLPLQPVAPSLLPCFWDASVTTRELTIEEIERLVKAYGNAAAIVKAAGIDIIEVHGYGGYLLDQFQTPLWNKRTDKYGGSLDNRLRLSMELIDQIKNAAGADFPIIYKFSPEHYVKGGIELKEGLQIARRLQNAGVAALHVSAGCYETWYWSIPPIYQPPGCQLDIAEAVKKVVDIPVIADGKLGYPDLAERVLQEGKADFIALGRPLLADAEWLQKVKEGRPDDIRPCIGDSDGCTNRHLFEHKSISCTVNPSTGMEKAYALTPALKRKTVLVIGGGPGGLEAARVAASRGHEVVLWEKTDRLGGNLISASAPGFKSDVRLLIDYLTGQVKKLGVKIQLTEEATPESVRQMSPEVAIVATGATSIVPDIPGIKGGNVLTAIELLTGKREAGKIVVIAGGGIVGCETAVYLAEQGKKVTVVEMMKRLMPEKLSPNNRMLLLEMVRKNNINVLTSTRLLEMNSEGAIIGADDSGRQLEADSIVLALGLKSESILRDALKDKVPELFAIGDCVQPRRILHAMWEGFNTARLI